MTKDEALKIALDELVYASSYCNTYDAIDAVKEALAQPEERNFCPRCGKRTADIHTCTPPQ